MKLDLTHKEYTRRILKDLSISIIAITILACAAYFLDLMETLAEWTGKSEFRGIDASIVIFIYCVWLLAIFSLRRVNELRDIISERCVIEKDVYKAEKMGSMAKMVTGITHDFNNLLMLIIGLCDMALESPDAGSAVCEDLKEIRSAGKKASSLIKQLLALGRTRVSDAKPLNINKIISDMELLLEHLVDQNIKLEIKLDPDIRPVKANSTQIEEILTNLALNAYDAMSNGGKLTIETSRTELYGSDIRKRPGLKSGEYVKLSITDTGSGIDAKIKSRIFEPFFSTKEKGSGLGLSMVSGIIKQNNGNIEVESEPGAGTTFRIYLPCIKERSLLGKNKT